jgi:hypothetical protein
MSWTVGGWLQREANWYVSQNSVPVMMKNLFEDVRRGSLKLRRNTQISWPFKAFRDPLTTLALLATFKFDSASVA